MKITTLGIFSLLSLALAPLTLKAIQIAEKKINCPFVYMTQDKEIMKVLDSKGKEIFPESLDDLEYYEAVWVSPNYK
jgi:hypothetical protein